MRKRHTRWILFFILLFLFSLAACGKKSNRASYDPQNWNFEHCDGNIMAETEDGYYVVVYSYLYYLDKQTLSVTPLCDKANCLHEKETDALKKRSCNAYLAYACRFIFQTGNKLFLIKGGNTAPYELQEYTLGGKYKKRIAVLPEGLQKCILHNGVFYYTYYDDVEKNEKASNDWGVLKLVSLSSDGKKTEDLLAFEGTDIYAGNFYALGDLLYFFESGTDSEGIYQQREMVFNLKTGDLTEMECPTGLLATAAMVCCDGLLRGFYGNDEVAYTFYQTTADGRLSDSTVKVKYPHGLLCTFDEYFIQSNLFTGEEPYRYAVYRGGEFLTEFDLSSVDGLDLSRVPCMENNFYVSNDRIMISVTSGTETFLVALDRTQIDKGTAEPHLLFTFGQYD